MAKKTARPTEPCAACSSSPTPPGPLSSSPSRVAYLLGAPTFWHLLTAVVLSGAAGVVGVAPVGVACSSRNVKDLAADQR
jgi:hypothetical protein